MAKRSSSRRGRGLIGRVYSPLNHVVSLTRNVGRNAFSRTGRIVNTGLGFVQQTGRSVVGHADGAVSNLLGKRKSRRAGRKSRRATRKNRK
jgi:hypothetical protein